MALNRQCFKGENNMNTLRSYSRRADLLRASHPLVLALLLSLGACGGGGDSPTAPPATVMYSLQSKATVESAGSNCPSGGARIDSGIDGNNNGVLDASEITSTQYVCNGAAGSNGANGSNGLNALVSTSAEAAGTNCANGGFKVDVGADANNNAVLDAGEISSTRYVCNGLNGSNGTNGLNSLMAIVAEAAGSNCTYGGRKISSGLDANRNSALDAGEVSSTTYLCSGPPAGLAWWDVTGTAVQAQPNNGYLADNAAAQVLVTLPASPALGDVVAVTGASAGGWKIAQNAGQLVNFKALGSAPGASWTVRDSARDWFSVASSADGSKLVAVVLGGQIYTSTDSGRIWTARDSARDWFSVASSADGSKLVAVEYGGQIYTSTDSGLTWTARDSARNWRSVASSADGSKLIAVVQSRQIYTSTDSGLTWTARDSARFWYSVASSADGSKLVAVVSGGQIYNSTDSGLTWTARDSARNWQSVTSSADGSKLVAVASGGQIYTSTDSGLTWTARDSARDWFSVASSADGSKLVAVEYGGQIHTSNDSGLTWTARDSARHWYSVASSADGSKLVAVEYGGPIYTSAPQSTPGTSGYVAGGQFDNLTLQYLGSGMWDVLNGHVDLLTYQ